ncbi:MAG: hypothetical protein HC923_09850 [Myxococcales bacterium]|nr:hypothetical protein [Myxococcales bacterium]
MGAGRGAVRLRRKTGARRDQASKRRTQRRGRGARARAAREKGETLQLKASLYDAKDRYIGSAKVAWDSSDRTVLTISRTGLVTALSSGDAEVIARVDEAEPRSSTA